jgi:hypothetical protein
MVRDEQEHRRFDRHFRSGRYRLADHHGMIELE